MPNDSHVAADFQDAQTGKGTRYLTIAEARQLLGYCVQRSWAIQSMEVSEVVGELEYPRLDHSLLGLTDAEKSAATVGELAAIARDTLMKAESENRQFIFKIWIDKAHDLLGKRGT